MKAYVAICSLCLLAGTALGHFNGRYSAASHFIENCDRLSMVEFHDKDADVKRRFHCFEIAPPTARNQRALVPMI